MTKKELVLSAMSGQIMERTPTSFWFHFSGDETYGDGSVNAHLRYLRKTGVDFLKIMNDSLAYQLPEGIEIKCAADWRKIKPQGRDSTFVREAVERVKRINDALDGEVATFYTVFAPVSTARHHVLVDYFQPYKQEIVHGGEDDVMLRQHLAEDEEAVLAGLDAIAEDTATLIRAVVEEGGASGLFISIMSGEMDRFTEEEYRRWVRPSDLKIIQAANEVSPYNIVHYCGYTGVRNNLDLWKDYPIKVVNWSSTTEGLDPTQARAAFGEDKVLLGGLKNGFDSLLYTGTKEDIQAEVRRLLNEYGKTPFILGADCTLPPDIDWARIRWVVEEVNRE